MSISYEMTEFKDHNSSVLPANTVPLTIQGAQPPSRNAVDKKPIPKTFVPDQFYKNVARGCRLQAPDKWWETILYPLNSHRGGLSLGGSLLSDNTSPSTPMRSSRKLASQHETALKRVCPAIGVGCEIGSLIKVFGGRGGGVPPLEFLAQE